MHAANRAFLAPHRMYTTALPGIHSPNSHSVSLHSSDPGRGSSPGYEGYGGREGREGGGGTEQSVAAVIARAYSARASQPHGDTSATPVPGNQSQAVSLAYAAHQMQHPEGFPYGLSGVPHMPAYNYTNELFHYATNGFPRKSRICSYCSKVFTRSTTRRYHEGRCPLLRAAGSLMKGREAAAAANIAAANGPDSPEEREGGGGMAGPGARPPPLIAITNDSPPSTPGGVSHAGEVPLAGLSGVTTASSVASHNGSSSTSHNGSSSTSQNTSSPATSMVPSGPHAAITYGLYARGSPTSPQGSVALASNSAASQQLIPGVDQNRNSVLTSWKRESPEGGRGGDGGARDPHHHHPHHHPAFPQMVPTTSSSSLQDTPRNPLHNGHQQNHGSQPTVFSPMSGASHSPSGSRSDEEEMADSDPEADSATFKSTPLGLKPEDLYSSPAFLQVYRARLAASMQVAQAALQQPQVKSGAESEPASPKYPKYATEKGQSSPILENSGSIHTDAPHLRDVDNSIRENHYAAAMETEECLEEEEEDDEDLEMEAYERKPCPVCSEPVGNLKVHERLHQRYKPNSCRYCGQRFIKPSMRISHQRLHPQGPDCSSNARRLGCVVCGLIVVTRFGLRQHVHREHYRASVGLTYCRYCESTVDNVCDLKRHFLSHRNQVPKAERLSIRFLRSQPAPREAVRLFHQEEEEEEEEATRELEPHSVESKTSQDSPPIPTSTVVTPNREGHKVHSNGKGSGSREMEWCRICEKEYPKSFMRYHEREHADQKPYECSICKKRFGYKNNMKSHMKLHAGIKPYQCQICMAKFTRGSTLRRHARRHGINSDSVWDFFLKKSAASAAVQAQAAMAAAAAAKTGSQGSPPMAGSRAMKADPSLMASINKAAEMGGGQGKAGYSGFPPATGFSPSGTTVPQTLFNAYPHMVSPAVTQAMLQPYMNMAAQAGYLGYHPPAFPATAQPHPSSIPAPAPPPHQAVQSDALDFSMPEKQRRRNSSSSSTSASQRPPSTTSQRPPSASSGGQRPPSSLGQRPPSTSTAMSQYSVSVLDRSPNRHPAFPPTPLEVASAQARQYSDRRYALEERTKEMEDECARASELRANAPRSDNYPRPNRPTLSETVESYLEVRTKGSNLRQAPALAGAPAPVSTPLLLLPGPAGHHEAHHDFGTQVTLCCAGSPHNASSGCSDTNHRRISAGGGALDMSKSPSRGGSARLGEDLHHESIASLMSSGRLFRCSHCECFFGDYTMYSVHQKFHLPNRPFACFICHEDCRDRLTFSKHLLGHLNFA